MRRGEESNGLDVDMGCCSGVGVSLYCHQLALSEKLRQGRQISEEGAIELHMCLTLQV